MRFPMLLTMAGVVIPWSLCGVAKAADAPSTEVLRIDRPITVDGSSADWPQSLPSYRISSADGEADVRLASDAENLYVFMNVRDDSPMKNSAARPQEAIKGGDAIGLFLGKPGPEQRIVIAAREGKTEVFAHRTKSEVKRPYAFTSPVGEAHFEFVDALDGAKAALVASSTGYVAEVALTWKSLGFDAVPESVPFDVQVIFSDPAGTTNVGSIWLHAVNSPAHTVEDLPTEARLYPDTWGTARFVTSLGKAAVPVAHRESTVTPGVPIELTLPSDGQLSLIVVNSDGAIVRELLKAEAKKAGKVRIEWDGRDRYGDVLPAGEYQWKAILFDGMYAKFMGSVGASGRPPYRTPDGMGAIGGQHGVPTSLAADAGGVYMSNGAEEGQPAMRKIDARTGKSLWKRSMGGFGAANGIAASEKFACLINMVRVNRTTRAYDLIRIDPATGKDLNMGKAPARARLDVPTGAEFGGIAIVGNVAYYSLPKEDLIAGVDLTTGATTGPITIDNPLGLSRLDDNTLLVCSQRQVIKLNVRTSDKQVLLDGLDSPRHAVVDASGNIYVSLLGEAQQIAKFDRGGKEITRFGRGGAKPPVQKEFDPMAIENITVLAIGPDRNLWLCETTNAPKRFIRVSLDGKWQEDYYGAIAYNVFGPDLDDPSIVYYNPGGNERATTFFRTSVDYDAYRAKPEDPAAAWKITAAYDLRMGADGKSINELMTQPASAGYGHVFVFTGNNGKRYLFRTSKANRTRALDGAALWVWENETWVPAAFLSRDDEKFGPSWADTNRDGLPQDNERYTGLPTRTFAWIDRDLVLHGYDGTLAPASISADGIPTYASGAYKPYFASDSEDSRKDWTFVSPAADGAVFYASNVGPGRKMSFWDRADEARIMKVENGKLKWVIGEQGAHPNHTQLSTISGIAGIVDDVMLVHLVEPSNYVAITTDGLTLGDIMRDEKGVKHKVGPDVINIESFTGLYIKDEKTSRKMLFAVSSGDDRILEVVGPKKMLRFDGTITLDAARPRAIHGPEIPYQTWYGNSNRDIAVDGIPNEWHPESRGLPLYDGGAIVGDVRLRRDAGTLAIYAGVLDRDGFGKGESLTLTIHPTDAATKPVTIRIEPSEAGKASVMIEQDGKPVTTSAAKAVVAKRWMGLGYHVEAEIPLADLPGITVTRPQKFRRSEVGKKSEALVVHEAELPDLKNDLKLGVTLQQVREGNLHQITWPSEGGAEAIQVP